MNLKQLTKNKTLVIVLLIVLFPIGIFFLIAGFFRQNGFLFRLFAGSERRKEQEKEKKLRENEEFPEGTERYVTNNYDLFLPKEQTEGVPVIVNLHGGGWIAGCKENNAFFNARMAEKGYVVLSVEFKPVPESTIKEQLHEIAENIREGIREIEYITSVEQIFLTGDSSGAMLGLYLAAALNHPALAEKLEFTETLPKIQAMGFFSGLFYTTGRDRIGRKLKTQIWGNHYRIKFGKLTDPDHLIRECEFPAMRLYTSVGDEAMEYSQSLFDAAQKTDNVCSLVIEPDESCEHNYVIFDPSSEPAEKAIADCIAFFETNR